MNTPQPVPVRHTLGSMPEGAGAESPQTPATQISRRIFIGAALSVGVVATTWNWIGKEQKKMTPRTPAEEQAVMASTPQAIKDLSRGLITPVRSPILHTPDEYGLAYEDLTFASLDGTPLEAWWIPCAGSDKLVIANHPMNFNRYGIASHLQQWAIGGGNDIEVNYMADYKNLHDAGYNVLTYDSRNFGNSAAANGGIFTWGLIESRDVAGSLQYVKSRPDTRTMTVGLLSRCMGGNATYIAMTKYPELFADVRCIVNPQPTSLRPFVENNLAWLGAEDQFDAADWLIRVNTGFTVDQLSPLQYAKNCHVPTFIIQVRNDVLSKSSDVQAIFDNISAAEKKLFWIEGSTRRWDGYNYFPEHPEQMIEWFDKHMK